MFTETLKPFYSTGLTQEQRGTIQAHLSAIISANTKILEVINEMEDSKKVNAMMRGTEKIGNGSQELFMLIS